MIVKVAESRSIASMDGETPLSSQRTITSHLRLIDYFTFWLVAILTILLPFFHSSLSFWPLLVIANLLVLGLMWAFTFFVDNNSRSKFLIFLRDAYPFFFYIFVFKETSLLLQQIFPFWLEPWLIQWDLWLFGTHPTVWVQSIFSPWLTEVMAFSYWSYYIFISGVGIVLYLRNRSLFHAYTFHVTLTLYMCYFLFLFLTARSPQETLSHLHDERVLVGFFDHFVAGIQSGASISGAAFPSSHVAAQWMAWLFFFRFNRTFGWIALPVVVALTFSVVYMQYHYAVDAIAGFLIVFLSHPLATFLERKFQRHNIIAIRV